MQTMTVANAQPHNNPSPPAVVARTGWLNGVTSSVNLMENEPLVSFVRRYFPMHLWQFVRVTVNGKALYNWKGFIPGKDDHVLVYVLPAGGDGNGKGILSMVAAIGLSVVSGGLATGLVGASSGFAFGVTRGLIMLGGSLVLNAMQNSMIKPPAQPLAAQRDDPFFTIKSSSNEVTPLGAVQRLYGRMRVFPRLAARPYPLNEGDTSYYNLLFDFGYGPLQLDQASMKLGETSIKVWNEANDDNVVYHVYEDFKDSSDLKLFTSNGVPQNFQIRVNQAGVSQTTADNAHGAVITLSFFEGMWKLKVFDDGYATRNTNYLNLKFEARKSGVNAPYQPLTTLAYYSTSKSVELPLALGFGDTTESIRNWDYWSQDGWEYEGLRAGKTEVVWRLNDPIRYSPNRSQIKHYLSIGHYMTVHSELPAVKITNRTLSAGSPYYVDYDLMLLEPLDHDILNRRRKPGEAWQYPYERNIFPGLESFVPQNYLHLVAFYQPPEGSTWFGRELEPFEVSLNVKFVDPGKYDIRITRLSSDPNNQSASRFDWISLYSLTGKAKDIMQPLVSHTVVEMRIKATEQLSGQVPSFSCVAHSKLPVYENGAWSEPKVTSNPAWAYCDVLCGSANKYALIGAERDRLLDIDRIAEWAQYCDDTDYQCNLLIEGVSTVKDTLQTIASTGRAAPSRNDAKYSVIRDTRMVPPVQLITPKNTTGFSASLSYVQPPHGLKCSFVDQDQDWTVNEIIVYADGYDEYNATVFEDLNLAGSTSYHQVYRMGRYYLAQGILQRERVTCSMDIENLVCQRGDIVLVAHDVLKTGGLPRRVVSIDAINNIVTIDEPVSTTGDQYFEQLVLLAHFDGLHGSVLFYDSSPNAKVITPTEATIDTNTSKWGGAVDLRPAPLRRYLSIASHTDFDFGFDTDFTIEAWFYNTDATMANQTVFANWFGGLYGDGARFLTVYGSGVSPSENQRRVAFGGWDLGRQTGDTSNPEVLLRSASTITLNRWYHIAVTRKDNVFRLFVDGKLEALAVATFAMDFSMGGSVIGANGWNSTDSFNGYIDDVRVSRVCRYDGDFTIPIAPFDDALGAPDTIRLRRQDRLVRVNVVSPTEFQFGNPGELKEARFDLQNQLPQLSLPSTVTTIRFNGDGSLLFAMQNNNLDSLNIIQYTLATEYDLASITSTTENLLVDSALTISRGCFDFSPDGMVLAAIDTTNQLHYYTLPVAWGIGIAVEQSVIDLQLPGVTTDIRFTSDGLQLWVINQAQLYAFDLAVAFDLDTISIPGTGFMQGSFGGFYILPFGTGIWIVDTVQDVIQEYILDTPFDLNTARLSGIEFDYSQYEVNARSLVSHPDSTYFYIGGLEDRVTQFISQDVIAEDFIEGDLLEYGVTEEIRAPFIVEEITSGPDLSANLKLVEQRPEIEFAIDQPIPPRKPRPGATSNYAVDAVLGLRAQLFNTIENTIRYSTLTLKWQAPVTGSASYYNVYQLDETGRTFLGSTETTEYFVERFDVSHLGTSQTLEYQVVPVVERIGIGKPANLQVTIEPDNTPPPDVERLSSNSQTESIVLFWPALDNDDVHHYEIRYSADVYASWGQSSRLVDNIPAAATETMVPLRAGRYFIKAVDAAGNYSVNAASTRAQVDDVERVSLYSVIQFDPFTSGMVEDAEVVNDKLQLIDGVNSGFYCPDSVTQALHFSKPTKVRLTSALSMELFSLDENLEDAWFDPLEQAVPLSPALNGIGLNLVDAQVMYRHSDGLTPISEIPWTRLIVADVTATDVEFIVQLDTLNVNYKPIVNKASVIADWVERTEAKNDVSVASGTQFIEFEFGFKEVPTVSVSLKNENTGNYVSKGAVTTNGFAVTIFDAQGNAVSGTIDWVAYGYGKEYRDTNQLMQQYNDRYS